ncbi:tetraspanin-33-like [Ornithodoros turicata]|uniref:tetraspanin-33-like n=1 Tax=Ornithodoros turicata TaxID=34597 RepID=UPI00313A4D50
MEGRRPAAQGSKQPHGSKEQDDDEGSTLVIDIDRFHRYSLLISNFVVMLTSGVLAAGCAISLLLHWDEVIVVPGHIALTIVVNLEIPCIGLGLLCFLTASVGFIGTLRENMTLLKVYGYMLCAMMWLILITGLVFIVTPVASPSTVEGLISIELVEHYNTNQKIRAIVDKMQSSFRCCGITRSGFRDWNQNMYFNCSQDNPSPERCSVPDSCCIVPEDEDTAEAVLKHQYCGKGVLTMGRDEALATVYSRNCVDAAIGQVRRNTLLMSALIFIVIFVLCILGHLATDVVRDLGTMQRAYDKYYRAKKKGLKKKKAKMEAMQCIPKNVLVDLTRSVQPRAFKIAPPVRRKLRFVEPCQIEFDRNISCHKIPQVSRCKNERAKVMFSPYCRKHVFDPNCAPRLKTSRKTT